ncbi:MAG: lipoyl(octanoyl) transferase LipB [Halofilum sp. (in: g-proteobacteria)]
MNDPIVRRRGRLDYEAAWMDMRVFTDRRDTETPDEFWLVEHPPVFTLGRAARREHVLDPGDIPVVQVDRGGQVTYHGPGQIVLYALVDLPRRQMGVRRLVTTLEDAILGLLAARGVTGHTVIGAPGVYVEGRKIAALGLRVRRGCSFHGLALNVDCDLQPFSRIDPCGYPGLPVTRTRDEGIEDGSTQLGDELAERIAAGLGRGPVSTAAAERESP